MEWIQIQGRTWMFSGITRIGVYLLPEENQCLLIDSGANIVEAKQALELLQTAHLQVWGILNTHAHGDHISGNQWIQQATHCRILACSEEAVQIEHPQLQAELLYSAEPLPILRLPLVVPAPSHVTDFIAPGRWTVQGKDFEILNLAGHTAAHCGVVTPDGVRFLGDALLGSSVIQKMPYPYVSHVKKALDTLAWLGEQPNGTDILSHAGQLPDLQACVQENQEMYENVIDWHIQLFSTGDYTREEVLQHTLNTFFEKNQNVLRYFFIQTSVSAFLTYLCEQKQLRYFMKDGMLRFALRDGARIKE